MWTGLISANDANFFVLFVVPLPGNAVLRQIPEVSRASDSSGDLPLDNVLLCNSLVESIVNGTFPFDFRDRV
jgi:hypothetical protein